MKKIIFLFLISPFFVNAQTVAMNYDFVVHYVSPNSFHLTKITTQNDSIISGYVSFASSRNPKNAIRWIDYLKEKPSITDRDVEVRKCKRINSEEIKKLEIDYNSQKAEFVQLDVKGSFGDNNLLCNIYKLENISLYTSFIPNEEFDLMQKIQDNMYYVIFKKNQTEGLRFLMIPRMPDKTYKILAKQFEDCPELQQKIKAGEFKSTHEGLIQILNYYNVNCGKNN